MKLVKRLQNSALVALGNQLLATVAFVSFVNPRFSNLGFKLLPLIFAVLVVTACLFLRDLWNSGTRGRAGLAFCLSLPIVFLFQLLAVWEGPLYISARPTTPLRFQVRGPAGFWGLKILHSDHQAPDYKGEDTEFVWTIEWMDVQRFPPRQLEFSYGIPPAGFQGWTSPPLLDPNATYTLIVKPAMGENRCYLLRGTQITEYVPYPPICRR